MILQLPNLGTSTHQCGCDITDKHKSQMHYICTMFNRTNQMFEYSNLPDTIPARYLELILQICGRAAVAEVEGALYAFAGNPGGAPDPYYRPTIFVVANPALKLSKSYAIANHLPAAAEQYTQGDCVMMRNDTQEIGLLPMNARYASQMVENDISIRMAQINSRVHTVITATTDNDKRAADAYLEDVVSGHLTSIGSRAFLEGIDVKNPGTQSPNTIIQLIELQQYLKASWFNDIGLNANFNMKREYLSTEELRASTDVLIPLIDDMLKCRQEAIDAVNSLFGTNITVKKNSAWENKQLELDVAQDKSEAEVINLIAEATADGQEATEAAISVGENVENRAEELAQNAEEQADEPQSDQGTLVIVDDNPQTQEEPAETMQQLHEAVVEAVAEVVEMAMDQPENETQAEADPEPEAETSDEKEDDED